MDELRDEPDFTMKSLDDIGGAEIGTKHLECDVTVMVYIAREIDGGHSARADLACDVVASLQCGTECVDRQYPPSKRQGELRSLLQRCKLECSTITPDASSGNQTLATTRC